MRYLFVGGPGRSGTSFVAERLGTHPEIASIPDTELKILCEKNGLPDLMNVFCETYSPNRAVSSLHEFECLRRALMKGQAGQTGLSGSAQAGAWDALFARFTEALCRDGHPVEQTEAGFLAAARQFLSDVTVLAMSELERTPSIFMEKTPHNLLALDFLVRLAPGASYLHVMRDPRSVAWSLTRMSWGPDRLETAAEWVASYCRAWQRAQATAADLGLPLMCLHIEDAVATPGETSQRLATWLGIETGRNLMHSDNPEMLNRWVTQASAPDRTLLDERLGGWLRHFGYDPETVGRRLHPSPPTADQSAA